MTFNLGVVTGSLSPAAGGLFQSVRTPARALAARPARVTVYGLRDDLFDTARGSWDGVDVEAFAVRGPARFGYSPDMLQALVTAEHDLLHLHGIWSFPSYATDAWRRRTKRPTIISPRGMLDPWALRNSALRKRLVRALYEDRNLGGAAVLHALNASEAHSMRAFGLRNPIAVIPNGVNLPDLSQSPPRPAWMARDSRRVLLFLGRIHPKKGLRELIAAWCELSRISPGLSEGWRLAIAGWDDGGHLGDLSVEVTELGLDEHVAFIGPLHGEEKAGALAHASAFVLPSHSEGMPMSVLEAWSYRLPVFMTSACNLPEGFALGAAIEIPVASAPMAERLAECLGDEGKLMALGAAGQKLVADRYTWAHVVADLRRLYAWTINGGAQPSFVQ